MEKANPLPSPLPREGEAGSSEGAAPENDKIRFTMLGAPESPL